MYTLINKMSYSRKRNYQGEIRRDGTPGVVSNYVDKFSVQQPGEYARCLLDPENSPCVSIPDEASYPTTLFTVKQEIALPASAAGGSNGIRVTLGPVPIYETESGASTDLVYAYSAAVSVDAVTNIQNTYRGCRLVAASCRAEFIGNDTNNKGVVVATSISRNFGNAEFDLDDTLPGAYAVHRNYRETIVGPVKDGAVVLYRPVDSMSFTMLRTNSAANYSYGQFVLHFTGLDTAAPNIVIYLTCHYEGLWANPTSGAVNVTEAVTPLVNPQELAVTQAILPAFPTGFTGLEWRSGLVGKLADGVSKAVAKAAPTASTLLWGLGTYGARVAGRKIIDRYMR